MFKVLKYLPFYTLSVLPVPALTFLSRLIYLLIYRLLGYRKTVVRENIDLSFPQWDRAKKHEVEIAFYKHFCELFVHSLKVLTISKRQALRRLHFANLDLLDSLHSKGKNIVLYGAHVGNWEWFAFYPLVIKQQFVSFYQEQSNSYFNGLSILMRERFGNICVESRTGYKQLMEMNREGISTMAYIIGDQSPMQHSQKIWVDFLNRRTAFLAGADRISRKSKAALLYPYVTRIKAGFYTVEFIEIDTTLDTSTVVQNYANLLAKNIEEQPELWLWTHRRWKLKEDTVR